MPQYSSPFPIPHPRWISHALSCLILTPAYSQPCDLASYFTKKKKSMKRKLPQAPPPNPPSNRHPAASWPLKVDEMSALLTPAFLNIFTLFYFAYSKTLQKPCSASSAYKELAFESMFLLSYRIICWLLYSKTPGKSCLYLMCLIPLPPILLKWL